MTISLESLIYILFNMWSVSCLNIVSLTGLYRLGLFIILQFDFIILPRFELWLFAACFTHVAILYPSLTGIT